MSDSRNIGFVGVGIMGHGVAINIARAGYSLVVFDHPGNQPVADLRSLGATSSNSLVDITRCSDVIFLCVTGSSQVQEIVTGKDGMLSELESGKVLIDCSTVEPHVTLSVSEAVIEILELFIELKMNSCPKTLSDQCTSIINKKGDDEEIKDFVEHLKNSYNSMRRKIILYLQPFIYCFIVGNECMC